MCVRSLLLLRAAAVCVCVEIKICCADARAQHPRPQLRHSDSTAERETMAGPEVRRRRFSTMAKTTMFATAVLVASASGPGVSAFVVDPRGGMLLRSGVANPQSLAGRRRGRFQEDFGARERLPGRRGRTGCCGRLVSRCICCLLCWMDVLGFLTLRTYHTSMTTSSIIRTSR